jgi:hypothetical protein
MGGSEIRPPDRSTARSVPQILQLTSFNTCRRAQRACPHEAKPLETKILDARSGLPRGQKRGQLEDARRGELSEKLQKSGKGVSEADQPAGSLLLVRGKQATFRSLACRISTISSIATKQG